MAHLTVGDLCKTLTEKFDEEVVETFRKNKIDGATLLELTQEDMKELGIFALGDRKKLAKLTARLASTGKPMGTLVCDMVKVGYLLLKNSLSSIGSYS